MDNFPEVMTVKQLAKFLQIGRGKAYELTKLPGFPAVYLGKRGTRIPKQLLLRWLEKPEAREALRKLTIG